MEISEVQRKVGYYLSTGASLAEAIGYYTIGLTAQWSDIRYMSRRKRKAWLITWQSSREDYLNDLGRPVIAAILDSRVPADAIGYMLQALYCSEGGLTLLEKLTIGSVEARRRYGKGYLGEIRFGSNPSLVARRVKNLYIERTSPFEQTVFWTEEAQFTQEHCSNRLKEIVPERAMSYTERSNDHYDPYP